MSSPPLLGRRLALAIALMSACVPGGRTQDKDTDAVEFWLPTGGFETGDPDQPVIVVEFGSYFCKYCRQFHESLMPALDSLYISSGRVRFRYVDVGPQGPMQDMAGIAECLARTVGLHRAQVLAFDAASGINDTTMSSDAISAAFAQAVDASDDLLSCSDSSEQRRRLEFSTAEALGALRTPTFVVGVQRQDGAIIGWPITGYYPERLAAMIDEVVASF